MSLNQTAPNECETCSNQGGLTLFMSMWMCSECISREKALQEKSKAEAEQRIIDGRERSQQLIRDARAIDESITLSQDIHNAKTVAIIELDKAIQSDETIPADKKISAVLDVLHARYQNLAKVIFEAREVIQEGGNEQRAIQTYMNTLLNKLREEERAKYKLSDINYNPTAVKKVSVKKAAASSGAPKKIAPLKAMKEMAAKFGIPVESLRARQIHKSGETIEESAREIAKKLGLFTPASANQ